MYAIVDWATNFNGVLVRRRTKNAILLNGIETPKGRDKEVVIVQVEKPPLKPSDDVIPND